MKISEAIEKLNAIKTLHGDVELVRPDRNDGVPIPINRFETARVVHTRVDGQVVALNWPEGRLVWVT